MAEIKLEGVKDGELEKITWMKDQMFTESEKIVAVTHMPGGLTNRNFKVEFEDGTKYAFRIAGEGSWEYLDRPCEMDAVAKAQICGTSPQFYWYDVNTGSNICRFVEGDTMHEPDFNNRKDVVEHAAALVSKIHHSGIKETKIFNPFAERVTYYEFLKEKNWTKMFPEMEVLDPVYAQLQKSIEEKPYPVCCCHNDCLAANFIYDVPNDKMEIIDWEYCGMNYYFFDLAALISENDMEPEMEEVAIRSYFGGEPTEMQRAEVLMGKFLMDGLWIPWSQVQAATKPDEVDFYWDWGYIRVHRCEKHMANPNWNKYFEMFLNR